MELIKRNIGMNLRWVLFAGFALFYLLRKAIHSFGSLTENGVLFAIFLFLIALFFLIMTLNAVGQLLKSKVALEISEKGIHDRVSFSEVGFFEWDKVEKVSLEKFKGNDHIIIQFKNEFQPKRNAFLIRQSLAMEIQRKFGNAIAINKDYINRDLKEVLEIINRFGRF